MRAIAIAGGILFAAGLCMVWLGATLMASSPDGPVEVAALGVFAGMAGGGMLLAALMTPDPRKEEKTETEKL